MNQIGSYPSIYAIGHRMIENLFDGTVYVEEKVDGSQFSFGIIDGELVCRSKNQQLILDEPPQMFKRAVQAVIARKDVLTPGFLYRGEVLDKPKHNVLAYDRTPKDNIVIFDIGLAGEHYLLPDAKKAEAERIGFECVPLLYQGFVTTVEQLKGLLKTISFLGGQKIEGIVVKNYEQFTIEKKIAIGKYVSEAFKEVAGGEWRKQNPTNGDIIQIIVDRFRTPARWQKAVQHLDEQGALDGSPKDIGPLMREVNEDVVRECKDEIKDMLYAWAWKQISRSLTAGLPEWYKNKLLEGAFSEEEESPGAGSGT